MADRPTAEPTLDQNQDQNQDQPTDVPPDEATPSSFLWQVIYNYKS